MRSVIAKVIGKKATPILVFFFAYFDDASTIPYRRGHILWVTDSSPFPSMPVVRSVISGVVCFPLVYRSHQPNGYSADFFTG
jgi:hypothetical protein